LWERGKEQNREAREIFSLTIGKKRGGQELRPQGPHKKGGRAKLSNAPTVKKGGEESAPRKQMEVEQEKALT